MSPVKLKFKKMSELYWLTRLDYIQAAITTAIVISAISMIVFIIVSLISRDLATHQNSYTEYNKEWVRRAVRYVKTSATVLIVSIIVLIFTPSTKEALVIYGVGGTIDYIQENETIQKLPDKVVNALDAWVDSWSEEKQPE